MTLASTNRRYRALSHALMSIMCAVVTASCYGFPSDPDGQDVYVAMTIRDGGQRTLVIGYCDDGDQKLVSMTVGSGIVIDVDPELTLKSDSPQAPAEVNLDAPDRTWSATGNLKPAINGIWIKFVWDGGISTAAFRDPPASPMLEGGVRENRMLANTTRMTLEAFHALVAANCAGGLGESAQGTTSG